MVDDGPDFVDEMEAELAARRPVPVQQDEPRGWAATENFDPQTGDFLFGSDGQAYVCRNGGWHRYPTRDRAGTGTTEYWVGQSLTYQHDVLTVVGEAHDA